jgi:hypothetical protein
MRLITGLIMKRLTGRGNYYYYSSEENLIVRKEKEKG